MNAISENEGLYLVGFRIDPDAPDPQVYTLYVDGDRPISREGRPVLFTRLDLADAALHESDCGAASLGPAPRELYTVFDVAHALYILDSKEEAPDGELLGCVNTLLDFLPLLGDPMPAHYRSSLERLADHLTFSGQFAEFLKEQNISRHDLTDAFFWCLGAVAYHARIIA